MPSPSVFISSTFYDLRYIRENLLFFVRSLGYTPILSEKGTIFFDPHRSAAEAAVAEVPNCQMFVLIIGGRYGTELGDTDQSVTNAEYQQAIRMHIPVFALVEQGAYSDYEVWRANRQTGNLPDIVFPNADDQRIFEFIDEVRSQAVNNALTPFQDFADIENYLRSQWASLPHSFLTGMNEEKRASSGIKTSSSARKPSAARGRSGSRTRRMPRFPPRAQEMREPCLPGMQTVFAEIMSASGRA
jgi:Domain of unknown function (DUF4062)